MVNSAGLRPAKEHNQERSNLGLTVPGRADFRSWPSLIFFTFFILFPSAYFLFLLLFVLPSTTRLCSAWSVSWPPIAQPAGVQIVAAWRALFYASFVSCVFVPALFLSFPFASCEGPFFCLYVIRLFCIFGPPKIPAIVSVCLSVAAAAPCISMYCRDVARQGGEKIKEGEKKKREIERGRHQG